jgi:hypothetical protein
MSVTLLLGKLALSSGISVLSGFFKPEEGTIVESINNVLGGVATNFIHQYSDKLNYTELSRFITQAGGEDYKELNLDIEKLMVASVPKTFKLLKESFEKQHGTSKAESHFFELLTEQARVRPNDATDFDLMNQDQATWLDKNTAYAWRFASLFFEDEGISIAEVDTEYLQSYITEHFQAAFEIVFTEGLKDKDNEKPLKSFIIKTLRGLEEQGKQLVDGQQDILSKIITKPSVLCRRC